MESFSHEVVLMQFLFFDSADINHIIFDWFLYDSFFNGKPRATL